MSNDMYKRQLDENRAMCKELLGSMDAYVEANPGNEADVELAKGYLSEIQKASSFLLKVIAWRETNAKKVKKQSEEIKASSRKNTTKKMAESVEPEIPQSPEQEESNVEKQTEILDFGSMF